MSCAGVNPLPRHHFWASEQRPNGGDEINGIKAWKNYGWPVVSKARDYMGKRFSDNPSREGMGAPIVMWEPVAANSAK